MGDIVVVNLVEDVVVEVDVVVVVVVEDDVVKVDVRVIVDEDYLMNDVMPRFPKYVKMESRRESATYIREKNTSCLHAKPEVTRTSYINLL